MSVFEDLVDALSQTATIDEFVITERDTLSVNESVIHGVSGTPQREQRESSEHYLDISLYRDLENGRGSTRVRVLHDQLARARDSWPQLIDRWARRAAAGLEPAWTLPPAAAPARVQIADPELSSQPYHEVTSLLGQIENLALALSQESNADERVTLRHAQVEGRHSAVHVHTSDDFDHHYEETLLGLEVAMAYIHPRSDSTAHSIERIRAQARRREDLQTSELLRTCARWAVGRAHATATPPGRYDLLLSEQALTPADAWSPNTRDSDAFASTNLDTNASYCWFAPLVAHSDSRWARHGLTRYQPGQSIHGKQERTGDPLTVVSDNTVPYGLFSRPVDDLGAPTRRFILTEDNTASGLSLNLREAALRGVPANGGVGNLRVSPGTISAEELAHPGSRPVLRVVALDHFDVDARSGAFMATVGLAFTSVSRGPSMSPSSLFAPTAPVTGGLVRGNLFDLWARARLSSETRTFGWYHGPAAIRFNDVEIS